METKKKADELIEKFSTKLMGNLTLVFQSREYAVYCALIAIDQIVISHTHKDEIGLGGYSSDRVKKFWQDVKTELLNS